ncbi:MAG TPA: hypothetical protein VFC37_21345 [Terracidiphilus sp.]|nr:hypothetical protein [Terracidiphilus sp.]
MPYSNSPGQRATFQQTLLKHFKLVLWRPEVSLSYPERDIHEADKRRDLNQRSDDANERLPRVQTEYGDGDSDRKLEVVAGGRER